eukprot:CAMPEP_0118951736 /NCGR_PEP_ID=MMETSP1169-20130426/53633_1 /TAXON_ID=36882 /ORGANISM="Pyramimonas obovata, Strain CCMP722" /LENGTH=67 /DNA_ID=CAMNT_0006898847 /DNA_START=129 /DNA_END=328 /DNA_ORIENTATION=+
MENLHSIFELRDIFDTLIVHLNPVDIHVLNCTSKTMKELLRANKESNKTLARLLSESLSMTVAVNQG